MTILSSKNISVDLGGREILKNVSLTVKKGELIGLIGPNGSGKSTWLRTLAGLLPYKKGSIKIDGKEISSLSIQEIAKKIGYVPQDTSVDFDFLVKDIVLMGRYVYLQRFGLENEEDYKHAIRAMEKANIIHLADRSIGELSGGQRQMVFIAKALSQQTKLLIMDEPTSALDINRELQVFEVLSELINEGVTVIAAIHDLNLAARFCTKLILINEGKVLASGKTEEVLVEESIKKSYRVYSSIRYDALVASTYVTALKRVKQ